MLLTVKPNGQVTMTVPAPFVRTLFSQSRIVDVYLAKLFLLPPTFDIVPFKDIKKKYAMLVVPRVEPDEQTMEELVNTLTRSLSYKQTQQGEPEPITG